MDSSRPTLFTTFSRCGSPAALALAVMLGSTGCDERAANVTGMQAVLENAAATIAHAEAGFVSAEYKLANPAYAQGGQNVALENQVVRYEYRQEELNKAIQDLQTVATSTGSSDGQKATALKLLAGINLSAARHQQLAASDAATQLVAAFSSQLLDLLAVIERTDAAGSVLNQNDAELLTTLNREIASLTEQRDTLDNQHRTLTAELESEQAKEKAQRSLAMKKTAEALAFAQEAFVVEGEAHFDFLDQESAAKREASVASIQADSHALAIAGLEVSISGVKDRLDSITKSLNEVTQHRDTAAKRLADTQTMQRLHQAERDKRFEELLTRFEALTAEYQSQVVQPLEQTREKINKAIERIETALKHAPADARDSLNLDLLTARADLAGVVTQHAIAAQSMAKLTQTLTDGLRRTGVPADSAIAQAQPTLVQQRDALVTEAQTVISDATTQAERSYSGEATKNAVEQIRNALNNYSAQLPNAG